MYVSKRSDGIGMGDRKSRLRTSRGEDSVTDSISNVEPIEVVVELGETMKR